MARDDHEAWPPLLIVPGSPAAAAPARARGEGSPLTGGPPRAHKLCRCEPGADGGPTAVSVRPLARAAANHGVSTVPVGEAAWTVVGQTTTPRGDLTFSHSALGGGVHEVDDVRLNIRGWIWQYEGIAGAGQPGTWTSGTCASTWAAGGQTPRSSVGAVAAGGPWRAVGGRSCGSTAATRRKLKACASSGLPGGDADAGPKARSMDSRCPRLIGGAPCRKTAGEQYRTLVFSAPGKHGAAVSRYVRAAGTGPPRGMRWGTSSAVYRSRPDRS